MKAKICALLLSAFLMAGACLAKSEPLDDNMITDQVAIRLSSDQLVKGGGLKVDVKNGVVTLSGQVDEPKAKTRAEKVTRKVKGVKQVINNLTIRK
jgi:hyperosmotically inducible periplasmic protein